MAATYCMTAEHTLAEHLTSTARMSDYAETIVNCLPVFHWEVIFVIF